MSFFGWMLGIAYLLLLLRHRERAMGPFLIPFVILLPPRACSSRLARPPPPRDARLGLRLPRDARDPRLRRVHVFLRPLAPVPHPEPADPARQDRASVRPPPRPGSDRAHESNGVSVGLVRCWSRCCSGLSGRSDSGRVWRTPRSSGRWRHWLVYGLLLWKDRRGWEGPRVALLSILGFGLIIFSYTVVNLYFSAASTASDDRRRGPASPGRLGLPGGGRLAARAHGLHGGRGP